MIDIQKCLLRIQREIEELQLVVYACTKILSGNQTCPKQWKQYLSLGTNKEELIEFLFHQWKQDSYAPFYRENLYITHGELCHCLCVQNRYVICTEIDELCSSHEEADTRLLLQCA